ncbi:MAM and LDL-receptor class A domain-containing protein 1 [Cheilinus undulatus]|uniref:MAM and LDL-receptor class A domain-containing protein 1 n=1 Tax=Cheilinus undulatus TaxID=241271 RepID=UPI001BD515D8|nr:MAM and LDL-receptor class A domain-containing protein 1 [Cheilinus undulatus]
MFRGSSETKLVEISKSDTDGWEKSTAFIGNQPGGYKLQFSFSPPFSAVKEVMLDDILFESCSEGDIPAGSDRLTCDFENDTCSWYHDFTASLLWKRSDGGFTDGPSGNGYYMLINAESIYIHKSMNSPPAARLISFPLPADRVTCVSFWYHMFGNSVGSLKFISKRSDEAETVVWMRSGTQGNKWRFADLTFNSEKPIQFIIEAVVDGDQGSIAIDNIIVTSSENGSCPAERECTFQGSLCGMQPQPSADFTWTRVTGATKPSNSSSPAADHTLGTEQGYYLSAQLWAHPEGSKGAVMTTLSDPTPPEGECLMFWYYMEGSGVGELNVYLQTHDNSIAPVQLWIRRGDQGMHWRHGRVTLLSPRDKYQVVFEAVVGDEPWRDIALDDLTVLNGACPPPGFCDFEMDLCGWVNSPTAESGVDWDWLSGDSEIPHAFIPRRDHTTNSAQGHFAYFSPFESEKAEIALLESETMQAVDQACLEMWHQAQGWSSDRPSYITLTLFVNESTEMRAVWSTNGFTNESWIQARVDYNSSGPHQIILQASSQESKDGSFSLDDVHIIRDMSCKDIIPTTTVNPPTTTTAPTSIMDCTFEQGLCSWDQEVGDGVNWTLSSGLQMDQPWDGPQYDHTIGNNQGLFLLLNGSGSKDGEKAAISFPVTHVTSSHICVGFWYYMLGPSVSSLDLLVQTESSEVFAWTRKGSQDPEWTNTQVTISMNYTTRIIFTGHRDTNSKGFIAMDDITVREGMCNNKDLCGFDSNLCGFENDVGHKGRWGRQKGAKHQVDHTYGTENGFYMTVMSSDSSQDEVAQLLTPEVNSAKEMCVRFWYWLPAGPSHSLSVHMMLNGETGDALWQRSGAPTSDWEVAEVTVSSPTKFYVVFSTVHVSGSNSAVKLDDVSVSDGACSPPVSCDFESGLCTWINIHEKDGHDWVLANGGFQGPPTDHTTQTPEGHFLLSSSQHQNHRSRARILSEWIHLKDPTSCLTLQYQMNNSDSGTLKVYLHSMMFSINSSGSSWTRFSQTIDSSTPFQLLIEAETNNKGFIAVDDIDVIPGPCQVNETTSGFDGCSFESGTCGWEDISHGQLQWTRGNASGNTGPSVDHTLGSELGWYMAVESDQGTQMSPAAMQSPTMKQASSTCTLHFYYSMFGEDVEELNVLLKEGSRTTALWWLSGNHGDSWHHGEVTVGRTPQDFTILFEASRAFTQPGHIAVDDIDFINCTLPEPQPKCPADMFMCNNNVCIKQNQVCDFCDDCGDSSDERNCEQQGFEERCSFEQGLCSWAGSDVDSLGAEWTPHTGQEAWVKYGPPRDHTENTAAGHYIVPGIHLIEKGQTSEVVSKTLLPSSNCTVRFFFFSLDDTTARLTARSRTQHSGSEDTVLWLRKDSQSYSWQRAEVTFSSSVNSKVVFRYERVDDQRGLVALDDISFSRECLFDPENNELPETSPTPAPATSPHTPTSPASTSTAPTNPCQDEEFFCWRSEVCILASLKCDYHLDCPFGEDEVQCGPCTFEHDQCLWADTSPGQSRWQRQKSSNSTEPPSDHTTGTGYYMSVNVSQDSTQSEARLQSPLLPPSSPFCQIKFHFHIRAESAGSLRVLMQQAEGSEAILWSRSHNTGSHWTPEQLPIGLHQQPYKVWFSTLTKAAHVDPSDYSVAIDDISFVNCEKSYQPPALSACGCSFEDGLCGWVHGAEDNSDWHSGSGPTETPNTGPSGDHTTGKGKYLYIESSPPSVKGSTAQLKSSLLPPADDEGYCFTFWYHMFGSTVGSLKVLLQTAGDKEKTLVWQKSGNQGDEWQPVQIHLVLQEVHQVTVEASVGGEAGDIAIDDISFTSGPCPASEMCDFEEGSCNWQQQTTDDFDWVWFSGSTFNPNTGPDSDHTRNTPVGHYYLLPSSTADEAGQTARLSSPLYPAGKGACLQLWYHMYGAGIGVLNVYQQSEEGKQELIFSRTGDQGQLWRFAQASLLPRDQPFRIVVEGVKSGPTQEGDMAFDDVQLTDAQCPTHGHCDFEINMCSWTNLGGEEDQGDWLRGRGASPNPSTGPSVDHTTNSTHGFYLYVDSSVGEWGDMSFLVSDVFHPTTRGHCLSFWYHMYGDHVGTLRVYINDRKIHAGGNEEGTLKWIEAGDKGDKWLEAKVPVKHTEAFWLVFVYQRGMNTGGDVALDDIIILPGGCYSEPDTDSSDMLPVGLVVGLTLLAGVIIAIFLFMLNRKWRTMNEPAIMNVDAIDQTSGLDLFESKTDATQHGADFSFFNNLYDPSSSVTGTSMNSADA